MLSLLLLAISRLYGKLDLNSYHKTVPWYNSTQHRPSLQRDFKLANNKVNEKETYHLSTIFVVLNITIEYVWYSSACEQ